MGNASEAEKSSRARLTPKELGCPFDRVTALACVLFDTKFTMVGLIDDQKTVFQSRVGIGVDFLSREGTATNLLVQMGPGAVLVVEDARDHPVLKHHPLVTGPVGLRFFIGATISDASGRAVGSVGIGDTRVRETPDAAQIESIKLLAGMAGDIVDQAVAARLQVERLEMLKLAEAMAGIGHWRLDVETRTVEWSDEVYRIHGVERAGFDPMLDDALSFYHPEDRPVLEGLIQRALTTGEGYRSRLRLVRADGAERLVLAHADTEQDEAGRTISMFGVFQDVTEQAEAENRIVESERRYRLLADRASDIIVCYGVDGIVTYASPAITVASGLSVAEVVGRPVTNLIHPDDVPKLAESFRSYVKGDAEAAPKGVVYRGLVRDGDERWFEARTSIIRDDDGRVVEFQDVVRDITDTKRLEDELTEARDRAEEGARAKSEFLANMSHELRTPLTSVIGFSGLLQKSEALAADERRYADRIATASEALLGVINDILDYSKLEADKVEMEPQPLDPRALATGAAVLVEAQCVAAGLDLSVEVDPAVPAGLMGDPVRLRQVLLNFLSNAVKFTKEGGIRVDLGGERLDDGRWMLKVSVTDSGIGIPEAKLAEMFDRFTQADASTTRVYGGTGLGLAISRRLVEMMGGDIGVESRPGEGSTFWFTAPLAEAEAAEAPLAGADDGVMRQARILVADDAPANRELVTALLGGMGLAVEAVCDGSEAVEAARDGAYDLILMDVHMPVMDGLAATRAIRALDGAAARTPIVALTANVGAEQVQKCLEAGMDGHLSKPIRIPDMVATLTVWLTPDEDDADAALSG